RKAEITLTGRGTFVARSDPEGKFKLDDIPPGHYFLRCERQGFLSSATKRMKGAGGSIELAPAQEVKGLIFKLMPQAVLTGRILDDDGDPAPNGTLRAMRRSFGGPAGEWYSGGQTQVNDIGEFRIAGLTPGKWILEAAPGSLNRSPQTTSSVPGSALATTYYPNARDASQSVPLTLVAGQEMSGLEIRLVRTKAVRISGKILTPEGSPATEAQMSLASRTGHAGGSRLAASADKKSGEFVLRNVAPGSYMVWAFMGPESDQLSVDQPLEVGNENLEDVTLRLSAPVKVTGRIVADDDSKPELSHVSLNFEGKAETSSSESASPKSDGSFSVRLQPGVYRVNANFLPGDYWLKSAPEIEISPGAAEVRLVIAPHAARVIGTAKLDDGKPASGATVAVLPKEESIDLSRLENRGADQNGHFEVKLAPGEYRVFAWESLERGAITDPDLFKQSLEKSVTVKVGLGERKTIDVPAQPFPE
ncbi:MAG: carboxypeptidase-like regulatory domain-containing protein, partial [Bryobacteraceae bacterium]